MEAGEQGEVQKPDCERGMRRNNMAQLTWVMKWWHKEVEEGNLRNHQSSGEHRRGGEEESTTEGKM